MRIGIQAWGSEGDVRPFLALGHALARNGHEVTLVLTDFEDRSYARYESSLGIRIREVATPVLSDPAELDEIGGALLAAGHPLRQSRIILERMFEPVVVPMFEAARVLCGESDLVVGHFFHHPVHTAAEAAGVPEVTVTLAHNMIPSGALPPEGIPDLGPRSNRLFWKVAAFFTDRLLLPGINGLRAGAGLPAHSHVADSWHSPLLDIVAVSATLCPRPHDWPSRHRVSGFLSLPPSGQVDPVPRELEDFLASGSPPVFVTFGSLAPKDAAGRRETSAILEDALARAGRRGVIQGLDGEGSTRRDEILHVGRVPHALVLPRCAAVVHHGGAGTTQTVLSAGVPSVVIPHVADQFFWGSELHRHGVAPAPLNRKALTGPRLAHRLRSVLGSPAPAAKARAISAALAAEDGCTAAVALIEDVARPRRL